MARLEPRELKKHNHQEGKDKAWLGLRWDIKVSIPAQCIFTFFSTEAALSGPLPHTV